MGERVLAAFGVAAAVDGVLTACLSAASNSADSAAASASSTAERAGSSEKARWRTPFQQAVAEGGQYAVFTGGHKSGPDDHLKHACPKTFRLAKGDIVVGARHRARADSTPPAGRNGANSSDAMPSASTRSTKQGAQT
ncbi:hypothetical protein ACIRP3_17795 [Streptomyces sp. NPDC101209]|uniref:hypothetical protein n=1 Tax=Streptomyces sp. NPDC101209 TaxID=3366129 RepID=UPI00381B77D1